MVFFLRIRNNYSFSSQILKYKRSLKVRDIIKLTTPKGKSILLNFENVILCRKTSNQHSSLSLNYSMGNPPKSAYVVVVEDFETILKLLNE